MNKERQYYFSHDANAKDDAKIILLIDQLGLEGYGIFWVLVETLRGSEGYKCTLKIIPGLAKRYNTSSEKMLTVIKQFDLFQIVDNEFFYSESLNRRMFEYAEKIEKKSIAGKKGMLARWNKNNNVITPLLQTDNNAITKDNYKRKENKIKEKENNIIIPPAAPEIQTLMIKTFGRNPTFPESELIQTDFLDKYGSETTYKLFKEASLKGFKKLLTLKESIEIVNGVPIITDKRSGKPVIQDGSEYDYLITNGAGK